jgi:hypothetical protein
MALADVIERIRNVGRDIVSIDVVTLTGRLTITAATDESGLNLQELYKELQKATLEGTLEVVAFTHIDLDRDAVNYVKSGLSESEKPIIDAHGAMVDTAQKARQAFLQLAKEFVGLT